MSRDFDVHLIFDLDIGVKANFGGYILHASRKSEFYLLLFFSFFYCHRQCSDRKQEYTDDKIDENLC